MKMKNHNLILILIFILILKWFNQFIRSFKLNHRKIKIKKKIEWIKLVAADAFKWDARKTWFYFLRNKNRLLTNVTSGIH